MNENALRNLLSKLDDCKRTLKDIDMLLNSGYKNDFCIANRGDVRSKVVIVDSDIALSVLKAERENLLNKIEKLEKEIQNL